MEISELRNKIDHLDDSIISLLAERINLAKEIIHLKVQSGIEIEDKNRERDIILNLLDKHYENINPVLIKKLFTLIFNQTKNEFYNSGTPVSVQEAIKKRPIIIAGPCAIESEEQIDNIAERLSLTGIKFLRGGAFKPRTSPNDFQGLGSEGLDYMLSAVCKHGMYSVTEVLDAEQLEENYDKIDVIQIGSRNMSSYALLKSVGKLSSYDHKPIILKRGFSATIKEFLYAAEYIIQAGNPNIILCLRGIRTFEQMDSVFRNTPDLASILELKDKTELPVIYDPSHASGDSKYVLSLAKAALNLGADGLMIECHDSPNKAVIDGKQAITPLQLEEFLVNEVY